MEALIACAGLIVVGALTPGPNNLTILRIAAGRGVLAALPAIAGIVLGGLMLLGVGLVGLAAFVSRSAWVRSSIAVCGGTYLIWLGASLVWQSFRPARAAAHSERRTPDGALALLVFQFANPKSWTLVLTVSAAAPSAADGSGRLATTATLFALFLTIPSICLLAWALFGRVASRLLHGSTTRAHFDRVMGLLLAGSAIVLLSHQ